MRNKKARNSRSDYRRNRSSPTRTGLSGFLPPPLRLGLFYVSTSLCHSLRSVTMNRTFSSTLKEEGIFGGVGLGRLTKNQLIRATLQW